MRPPGAGHTPSVGLADLPVSRFRAEGIDFARALLAYWVLLAHLALWAEVAGSGNASLSIVASWLGRLFQPRAETHPSVLGFIVLSGYCIHRSGFRRIGGTSVAAYATRRFFRIWPVYLFASAIGAGGLLIALQLNPALASGLSGTTEITVQCLLVKLTGISVWLPSLHTCSFSGNAPLTTAMVEEWLYFLYAIVFHFVLLRRAEAVFGVAVFVAWIGGTTYAAHSGDAGLVSWWHNGSLLGFLPYWWVGAAFLSEAFRRRVHRARWAIGLLWLTLTAVLLGTSSAFLHLVELRKVCLALLSGLLISALDRGSTSPWLRPGAWLGRAGYSTYALHGPLLILTLCWRAPWWLAGLLTAGAALLVYRFFEKPLTDVGKRLASARS